MKMFRRTFLTGALALIAAPLFAKSKARQEAAEAGATFFMETSNDGITWERMSAPMTAVGDSYVHFSIPRRSVPEGRLVRIALVMPTTERMFSL